MFEDIPKVAETGGVLATLLGGAWLVWKAFVKKNITERAEVNIYEMQNSEIKRLSEIVIANQTTIQLLTDKVMKLELAQAQEAVMCAGRIRELENKLAQIDHQAMLQAQIDQAARDGKIDRRNASR
jgi:hypothetical protein